MQDHVDVIERDDLREAVSEITKQFPSLGVTRWIPIPSAGDVTVPVHDQVVDDGGRCPPPQRFVWQLAGEHSRSVSPRPLSASSKIP